MIATIVMLVAITIWFYLGLAVAEVVSLACRSTPIFPASFERW